MAKNVVKKEEKTKKVTSKKNKVVTSENKASKKVASKKSTTKPLASKKTEPKKVSSKTTKRAANSSKTKTRTKSKKVSSKNSNVDTSLAKEMLAEYYDLPYRYNQTIVKILAQTPTTLFVYWDISDEDRNSLISKYGKDFFMETRPILVVHNITLNYSFEIQIDDFANSWYIRAQEPNCNYVIELGRRFNNKNNEYIYIDSSNNMTSQNDHILFEKSNLKSVLFKNVKTNKLYSKDFGDLKFINNIDKLYGNIYDVYSALYNEDLNNILGPSSGEFNFMR